LFQYPWHNLLNRFWIGHCKSIDGIDLNLKSTTGTCEMVFGRFNTYGQAASSSPIGLVASTDPRTTFPKCSRS
ncbi:MAG: hypothetical protein ACXAAK_14275, partial [Candidatus Thorarchaeota archaeon]